MVPRAFRTGAAIGAACLLALSLAVPTRPTAAQAPEIPPLPTVQGWAIAAPLLQPRSEQAVAELDGKVYLVGGYPAGRIPSDVLQIYDVAANRWSLGPSLPMPLHHAMAAGVNGKLYVIGGEFEGAGTGRPEVLVDTVYELDLSTATWAVRAPMPTARGSGGAAVLDGKIYVAGGRPPRGADFAVYDPAADTWTVLPDLPTQRNHLAMAAIDGKVYVAGGRHGPAFWHERTAVLEIYDPTTNSWTEGAPLPAPRGGTAGVAANGCLFVIGGEGNVADARGVSDENEAYNPRTNTWTTLAPMPTPTHGLVGAAFVDGRIFLPGGSVTWGGGTGTVLNWTYRPTLSCQ